MDRGLALALTAVVGGMVALQAPINSGLGKAVGNFQAAFVSFLVGTVILGRDRGARTRRPRADLRGPDARAAVPARRRTRRVLRLHHPRRRAHAGRGGIVAATVA